MSHRQIAKLSPQALETTVQLCQNLCLVSAISGGHCLSTSAAHMYMLGFVVLHGMQGIPSTLTCKFCCARV